LLISEGLSLSDLDVLISAVSREVYEEGLVLLKYEFALVEGFVAVEPHDEITDKGGSHGGLPVVHLHIPEYIGVIAIVKRDRGEEVVFLAAWRHLAN
jgi:hypothetical protein